LDSTWQFSTYQEGSQYIITSVQTWIQHQTWHYLTKQVVYESEYDNQYLFIHQYFLGIIDLFSLILHVVIKLRIMYYKKTRVRNFPIYSDDLGLMDFATQTCLLFVFIAFLILQTKVNSLTIDELNHFPGYFYMYILIFLGPCLIFIVVSGCEYIRNKTMRTSLLNEVSRKISCYFRERTSENT